MTRPNFLVIGADDRGFSDIGAFGGEINGLAPLDVEPDDRTGLRKRALCRVTPDIRQQELSARP